MKINNDQIELLSKFSTSAFDTELANKVIRMFLDGGYKKLEEKFSNQGHHVSFYKDGITVLIGYMINLDGTASNLFKAFDASGKRVSIENLPMGGGSHNE